MPRWLTHVVVGIIYHPPDANNRRMTDHILNTIDHIIYLVLARILELLLSGISTVFQMGHCRIILSDK